MISLSHQFLAFCRSKPVDEEYNPHSGMNCALAQFARSVGMAEEDEYVPLSRFPREFEELVFGESRNEDWTFGALADRVEKQLAEEVA